MKKLLYISIICFLFLSSCSKKSSSETVRLGVLKGPTGIGMAHLIEGSNQNKTRGNYSVTISSLPDEIALGFLKGELDIVSVPVNMASILYNKSSHNAKLLAVNTVDAIYLLAPAGMKISSVSDLKDKRIIAQGKGVMPDILLTSLLEKEGLGYMSNNIEWKSEAAEVIKEAVSSNNAVVMLPEPFVSLLLTKDPKYRILFSLSDEWKKAGFSDNVVISVVIANKEYASSHKKEIQNFLYDLKSSVKIVKNDPALTARVVDKLDIAKEDVIKNAIVRIGAVAITGWEAKKLLLPFYDVLFKASPRFIGGSAPMEDFYE